MKEGRYEGFINYGLLLTRRLHQLFVPSTYLPNLPKLQQQTYTSNILTYGEGFNLNPRKSRTD